MKIENCTYLTPELAVVHSWELCGESCNEDGIGDSIVLTDLAGGPGCICESYVDKLRLIRAR